MNYKRNAYSVPAKHRSNAGPMEHKSPTRKSDKENAIQEQLQTIEELPLKNRCIKTTIFRCAENTLTTEPVKCKHYEGNGGACDHRSDYNALCNSVKAIDEAIATEHKQ